MTKKIKCESCNKEFKDLKALAMHNSAKHNVTSSNTNAHKEKFKLKKRYIIGLVMILIIGSLIYINYQKQSTPGSYDGFAKCLTDNNATMYGTDWCGYCKKQKDLFGNSFKNINFVDCDRNREKCVLAGVQGYPTWIINNQTYSGLQSLERLAQITGCEIK